MKRCQVSRKAKFFNHVNRNVVYPTIFISPNLEEESNKNAVEITELNSDEDMSETEQQDNCNNNHSWCNITYRSHERDEYKVNKTAKDKRRQNKENENRDARSKYSDKDALNQFCTDFYGIDCNDRVESFSSVNNLHSDFFTILNNHRTSQTSSESNTYDDIEVTQYDESKENDCWNSCWSNSNDFYDNRNVTCDNDGNAEKQTIWIYSLKNQRYLSEHDYDLVKFFSKDTISTTDDEEPSKDIPNHRRIATPIPTYVPRMNLPLSPTLPTVTEVTEPNKLTSDSTRNADKNLFQRLPSGWFKEIIANAENVIHSPGNMEKSYKNNWQALPPRERKRLRQSKIKEQNNLNTKKDPETPTYCEPTNIFRNKEFSPESHIETFKTQIDEIESNENNQNNDIDDEKEVSLENNRDDSTSLCNLQKPQIKLSPETKTRKKDITYTTEKLDGNCIGESLPDDNELLEIYNYNVIGPENNDSLVASQKTGDAIEECASYRLFIRNMSRLKPAEWSQYLPLARSARVPSLHLSISVDTDFDTEKKSWFKRFLDIVNCCK